MSKSQRTKGYEGERELVNLLKAKGLKAERIPGSGAHQYQGESHDLNFYIAGEKWTVEAKRHKSPLKSLTKWRGEADVLATRADRGEWEFHLSQELFFSLVTLCDELLRERGEAKGRS